MIIDVLVCRPDGTQTMETREVTDDWNTASVPELPGDAPPLEYATYAELAQAIKEGVKEA